MFECNKTCALFGEEPDIIEYNFDLKKNVEICRT